MTLPVPGGIRVDELRRAGMGPARNIRLARLLGRYVRNVHDRGVYPQDFRAANILAMPFGAGWRFVLVDLDRVRRYRRVVWRRRRKNLVQIAQSFGNEARWAEQVAFLRAYLGEVDSSRFLLVARELLEAGVQKERERSGESG